MWRMILRNTLARRARLAFTMLAIVLGVTFVTGTLILTDTSRRLLDDQFRTASAGVDLTVRRAAAFDSAMGIEVARDPLSPDVAGEVRALPGVASAEPVVRGQGLLEFDGKAIVPSGPSMLLSWTAPPTGAFPLRAGRAPAADGEVVIDAATADKYGITLGRRLTVHAKTDLPAMVVGLAGFGDRPGLPNSTVSLVSLPTAQRIQRLGGGFDELAVTAAPGANVPDLQRRLGTTLGAAYEVSSSRDIAVASSAAAADQISYLQVMLLALAAAGLLVGAFLIANTFSMVVTQRTHELAVLRATGATGRQVLGSVLGEAFVLGLVASVLGIGAGLGAAVGLRNLAAGFGVTLPDGPMIVGARTVLISFAIGLLVTVLAAFGPARRAARVAPIEAMRRSSAAEPGRVVPAVIRFFGLPLQLAGVPGRLARESAAGTPRRTSATALALALGLALVAFTAVLATSIRDSVRHTYRETISADYVVESGRNEMLGGLPSTVYDRVTRTPEVAIASRVRIGHWRDGQVVSALTAVDPDTLPAVTNLRPRAGTLRALDSGGIMLAEHVAAERKLAVGDSLAVTFARTGTRRLPIVGLLRDRDALALETDYMISLDTYAKNYAEDVDASVFVRLAPGVPKEQGRRAIAAAIASAPTAQVRDQAAAVAGRTQAIDQILGLVTALLLLTILIALLGITNTLALSVHERIREIGLLRAVGMTRAQLSRMVRAEAVLIAMVATVAGVGLGVAVAAAAVELLGSSNAGGSLVLPGGQLALIVGTTILAGLIAGLLPARRAVRTDVLTAIASA